MVLWVFLWSVMPLKTPPTLNQLASIDPSCGNCELIRTRGIQADLVPEVEKK